MKKIKIKNNIIEGIIDLEDIKLNLQKERDLAITKYSVSDEIIESIKSKSIEDVSSFEKEKISIREKIDSNYKESLSKYDDYKELVIIPYEEEYDSSLYFLKPKFTEFSDKVEQTYTIELDSCSIFQQINSYRKLLNDTDYIIIKSYEEKLSLSDFSYSKEYLDDVIDKRKKAREKINELELLLKQHDIVCVK